MPDSSHMPRRPQSSAQPTWPVHRDSPELDCCCWCWCRASHARPRRPPLPRPTRPPFINPRPAPASSLLSPPPHHIAELPTSSITLLSSLNRIYPQTIACILRTLCSARPLSSACQVPPGLRIGYKYILDSPSMAPSPIEVVNPYLGFKRS